MTQKRPPFIVFEGADGVGKTTMAQWLAHEFNLAYLKGPSGPFAETRAAFDTPLTPVTARMGFYLGAAFEVAAQAEYRLNAGRGVVLDRYYYATMAYHHHRATKATARLEKMCAQLPQPDKVIVLKASFSTVRTRRNMREPQAHDTLYATERAHLRLYRNYKNILQQEGAFVQSADNIAETQVRILKSLRGVL
jgi:dTMP kinase